MKIIETNRLLLRHLEMADLDALFTLYSDPEMRHYFPDGTRSYEETREELAWFLHGHPKHPELGLWATIDKRNGRFIGRCGLLPWEIDGRAEVEIAYMIDKAYWGHGLGTEAARGIMAHGFGTLKLTRLICLIVPGNAASVRVAEKMGMVFEKEGRDKEGSFWLYAKEAAL